MASTTTNNPDLFYNVLPKNRAGGPLVNAGNENSAGALTSQLNSGEPSNFPVRLVVFITLAVLILIAGGYTLYRLFQKPATDTNQTNQQTNQTQTTDQNTQNQNTDQQSTDQQQVVAGVTTPSAWQQQYFKTATCTDIAVCGDAADPDRDGFTNAQEYASQTDPNNNDSDNDQISDGDEVNIFLLNPLKFRTANDPLYSDTDYVKGGYDSNSGQKYTPDQLATIKQKINQFGFHQPTVGMLGDAALTIYGFGDAGVLQSRGAGTAPPLPGSTPSSPEDKLDRDVQRQSTIKKIGAALLKYKTDKAAFPDTADFQDMYNKIKSYNLVATNPKDPVNQAPYVYSYESINHGADFTLGYLSETQNQVIKYHAADAQKDTSLESASNNDDRRTTDLETIRSALLIYSSANVAGGKQYIFPTQDEYKTAIVPKYLTAIPKDPKTGQDYEYQVSPTFNSFTLKALLENPPAGTTGYSCNQEECQNY